MLTTLDNLYLTTASSYKITEYMQGVVLHLERGTIAPPQNLGLDPPYIFVTGLQQLRNISI